MNDPTIDKTRQVTALDLISSDESVKPVSDGKYLIAFLPPA
jgi:DNA-directed RNA polymerase II subunit RPB3